MPNWKFQISFFNSLKQHKKGKHCLKIIEEISEILANYLSFAEHSVSTSKIQTE